MKSNFFVEYHGNKVQESTLVNQAKEVWKNEGNLVKDLKTLEIYYKPEENTCYYVFNEKISGSFVVAQ